MSAIQTFSSINDILGPDESRFFSSGYRRSDHHISNVILRSGEVGKFCVEAAMSVTYPLDWSKKSFSIDITPHFSTVDMLILTMKMVEAHLIICLELNLVDIQEIHIVDISIHAGTKPQETLNNIPVTAMLRCTEIKNEEHSVQISTYECRAGRMRAICKVEHPLENNRVVDLKYHNFSDISEMLHNKYYVFGYKDQKHVISDVNLDMDKLTADADVEIQMNKSVEYIFKPKAVSYLDVFVTCSQLAQVLLYSLDGLVRHETSTLWMLRTYFSELDGGDERRAKVAISSTQIIELNGVRWRNADIVGILGNKVAKITFAHSLPSVTY